MKRGKLYLIPITLGENSMQTIPQYVIEIIHNLDVFIVERTRTARRFISATRPSKKIDDMIFFELDKRNPHQNIASFLTEIENGKSIGLMSEAGCPGVADPGALVVQMAHQKNIEVLPLVGPSSILLALMGSGMNGQKFAFHGYLPVKNNERIKVLKQLENESKKKHQTQIFIETPYRNMALIKDALEQLNPSSLFCIAADISLETEYIQTQKISEWRKTNIPDLHKRLAVFLIFS